MQRVAKIILFVILLPMWVVWLILDIARSGTDVTDWALYDLFIN